MNKPAINSTAYIIENRRNIRKVTVLNCSGGLYTVRFEHGGGTRLRASRLYPTAEDAEKILPKVKEPAPRGFRPPSCWGVGKW